MKKISVQAQDFNVAEEIAQVRTHRTDIGAIVNFIGLVRDSHADLESLTLEHYPGMTEKVLDEIASQAQQRWALQAVVVIHRYGCLKPAEQIVMVLVASKHRGNAFAAGEYIMDYLKTQAPFWKKESTRNKETAEIETQWIAAKASDKTANQRWDK